MIVHRIRRCWGECVITESGRPRDGNLLMNLDLENRHDQIMFAVHGRGSTVRRLPFQHRTLLTRCLVYIDTRIQIFGLVPVAGACARSEAGRNLEVPLPRSTCGGKLQLLFYPPS